MNAMNAARKAWMIIDGYSLLHRDPELSVLLRRDLGLARQLLIRLVERVAADFAEQTTIVFDGRSASGEGEACHTDLDIRFAPARYTADTVIERLVYAHPAPENILVVTSDRAERMTVDAAGAAHMGCGDFLQRLHAVAAARRPPAPRQTLGDFFP